MALSNDDLQAIATLVQGVVKTEVAPLQEDIKGVKTDISNIKSDIADMQVDMTGIKTDISNIKSDMHVNNDFLLTEMERLHNIQTRKIDSLSEKVDTIRDNKETTDYLLKQLSDLKKRVDELENKIA